ncbi:hypothetical protein T06_4355 [Trichinella sp. T6]|nr:hypothetical protein T06_4355 [Trichinella sp. T6]
MNKAKDEKISVILRVGLGIIFAVRQFPRYLQRCQSSLHYAIFGDPNDNLHCLTCIDEDNDWFNLFSDLNGLENRNPFLDRPLQRTRT